MNYEIDLAALSQIELAELMAYLQLKNIKVTAVPNDGKPIVSGSLSEDNICDRCGIEMRTKGAFLICPCCRK